MAVKTATHANSAASAHQSSRGGPFRGKSSGGGNSPRMMVVNVAVVVAGFDPSSVTDDGETIQPAPAGATEQLQATF